MATKKKENRDSIAKALGASRVVRLKGRWSGGPLDWLALSEAVQSRLISRGGRPSDPHWDTKRQVPFRHQVWQQLSEKAKAISAVGRSVGPAQLAAIVIEESLASSGSNILQGQSWFVPTGGPEQVWEMSNEGGIVHEVMQPEIKTVQQYGAEPVQQGEQS